MGMSKEMANAAFVISADLDTNQSIPSDRYKSVHFIGKNLIEIEGLHEIKLDLSNTLKSSLYMC